MASTSGITGSWYVGIPIIISLYFIILLYYIIYLGIVHGYKAPSKIMLHARTKFDIPISIGCSLFIKNMFYNTYVYARIEFFLYLIKI